MTDEAQPPELNPIGNEPPTSAPRVTHPHPPARPKRDPWAIGGIVIAVACACSILCIALVSLAFGKILVERGPVETVLDAFMRDMVASDIDGAYALFSPRAQRQMSVDDFSKMLEGNNYALFEGYESLNVLRLNISVAANTNPDMPQGTVATASGEITYQGGYTGRFEAVLEDVNGLWKIHFINITIPPDKIQQSSG